MSSATTPRVVPGPSIVILRVLLAVIFVGAGLAKLSGMAAMVSFFEAVGMGQWLRFVVGSSEVLGALLLLTPGLAGVGALFLSGIMLGAVVTEQFIVNASPFIPLAMLAMLVLLIWEYRADTANTLARLRSAFSR